MFFHYSKTRRTHTNIHTQENHFQTYKVAYEGGMKVKSGENGNSS